MSDWRKSSRIASAIAQARESVNDSSWSGKASLLDPSRPFTPMVARDSHVFTSEDDNKRDWPVFYTEGSLASANKARSRPNSDRSSATSGRESGPGSGRKIRSKPSSRQTSRPSSSRHSTRSQLSSDSGMETPRSTQKFPQLYCQFSKSLRELKEKKTGSSVTPAALCEQALILLSKASRGSESLQACSAVFKLPLRYSGREESRYHKVMHKCLKRQFEHSVRQDFDEQMRRFSLVPLALKQLKKILKNPQFAPIQHVSYILGTFRNLSQKEDNQRLLVRCEAIPILVGMLHKENLKSLNLPSVQSQIKLIKEITSILRNLAVIRSHSQDFVKHEVLSLLGGLLITYKDVEDVLLGVCRILSKLTFFPGCRAQLSRNEEHLKALYRILENSRSSIALDVRACFIMGNLTVSNDKNRLVMVDDYDSKDCILLKSLQDVAERDSQMKSGGKESKSIEIIKESKEMKSNLESKSESVSDVENFLTKVVRLLANVCINERIGATLCKDSRLEILVELLERKHPGKNEELVLNVISAITNISFYQTEGAVLQRLGERLLGCLMPLLFSTNNEMLHEAVRVLGNFSRYPEFRQLMGSCRVDETMNVLLDHSNEDIIFATTGVILNISTDREARQALYANRCEGLQKVIECLYRFGQAHPSIATIVCKILINLSVNKKDESKISAEKTEIAELPTSLGDIWLPLELRRNAEMWCEEWLAENEDGNKG